MEEASEGVYGTPSSEVKYLIYSGEVTVRVEVIDPFRKKSFVIRTDEKN